MLRFIHLANLHTNTRGSRNDWIKVRLDYIRENYPGHILLLTGDLVDDGLRSQYIALKKMLIGLRSYACPGNHDYKLVGNCFRRHSAKLYDYYFGKGKFAGKNKPVVNVLDDGDKTKVMLIALDSNIESRNPLKFARGKIGLFQRHHLKKLLNRNPNIIKIIYFHHHLLWDNMLLCLTDAAKTMQVIYNEVDIVLFGHKHKQETWTDKKHKPYYIFAADNMPDAKIAEEIIIDGQNIKVSPIKIIT